VNTVTSESKGLSGLTWWSFVTLITAIPVWTVVVRSAVLSRVVDGGIWLSVSAGVADGLTPYEQVWDHKDPLFYGVMAAATLVSPSVAFFLDIGWFVVAGVGAGLLARSVMSADRAFFVGVVVAPLVLLGPSYVPGWTNTPGTALVLMTVGLFARRLPIGAGLAAGLLAFIKLPTFPLAAGALALAVLLGPWRTAALRAIAAMFAAMGGVAVVLVLLGWFRGALDSVLFNRAYASEVATYFGYEPGVVSRLARALGDWSSSIVVSAAISLAATLIVAVVWLAVGRLRSAERSLLAVWGVFLWSGTLLIIGLTYVWPHHAQQLALPTVVSVVLLAGTVPQRWVFPAFIALVLVVAFVVSGWGSWRAAQDAWAQRSSDFDVKVAQISEVPLDARLLASVPLSDFTYARLGSNDDRGFLGAVRDDAVLACPKFHTYDFSPPEVFAETLECIQGVDVVLVTDAFTVFGGSSRAPYALPVLDYVNANFNCLRIDDRQVCTRNR